MTAETPAVYAKISRQTFHTRDSKTTSSVQ